MIAMTVAGGLRLAAQEVKIDYGNQGEPASLDMGGDSFCAYRCGFTFFHSKIQSVIARVI
jgi:hypothetical protein